NTGTNVQMVFCIPLVNVEEQCKLAATIGRNSHNLTSGNKLNVEFDTIGDKKTVLQTIFNSFKRTLREAKLQVKAERIKKIAGEQP
ncbi:10896_t:CDS:2, partial [Funneliformis geosporum]